VKSIPLRTLGPEPAISYRDVLVEVVRRPLNPQQGIGIAEMRASIKVLDALERSNGTLELEDSDYEHLKAKLDVMQWSVADRRILTMIEDVSAAS
jgi:hypothetical protein